MPLSSMMYLELLMSVISINVLIACASQSQVILFKHGKIQSLVFIIIILTDLDFGCLVIYFIICQKCSLPYVP